MTLMYGIGCLIIAFVAKRDGAMFPNTKSFLLSCLVGGMSAAAFYIVGLAFKFPNGNVSIITTLIASHCLIAAIIGMLFMGEQAHIHVLKFCVGASMILGGVYIVSTSIKGS
jgi:drug/metabolite transporter (DMT)-like permease